MSHLVPDTTHILHALRRAAADGMTRTDLVAFLQSSPDDALETLTATGEVAAGGELRGGEPVWLLTYSGRRALADSLLAEAL